MRGFNTLEENQLLQNALKNKIKEIETLYASIPGGVIRCSRDEIFYMYYYNEGFLELVGYKEEEIENLFGNKLSNLIVSEDRKYIIATVNEQLKKGIRAKGEFRIRNKQGNVLWVLMKGQVIKNEGEVPQFCCVLVDITAEKKSLEALRLNEERYKIIVEQSNDIMFEWDFETDTMWLSDKYAEMMGIEPVNEYTIYKKMSYNKGCLDNIHPEDQSVFNEWITNTFKQTATSSFEFRLKTASNKYIWMRTRSTAICDQEEIPVKAVGVFSNVADEKATMTYLKQKAELDSLTKLYNKEETRRRIEKNLEVDNKDRKSAMIIIDIDNFKGVNDNLGHQFGDMVLIDIAKKIKSLFTDEEIVGRLGGDEFVVFLTDMVDEAMLYEKVESLTKKLRNTYYGENKKYKVSTSIGVAYYPQHGRTFQQLYKFADIALYESKNNGKDCYTIYHDKMTGEGLDSRKPLEVGERFVTNYFEGDLIYNIFEMLYETKDIETTINLILEVLGKKFEVDRVYVFENSEDGKFSNNTYEWCSEGIEQERESLQNISTEDLKDFLADYNEEGIFYCNDIKRLDEFSFEVLNRQGIQAFLHCAIYNEGKMKGFVGFDDCKKQRVWRGQEIATLSYISRILSIFILKKQISKELWASYQNYTEMLDNLNGYVYVIDVQTHETLYINKATEAVGIKVGEKCHKAAFESEEPCENCPVHLLNNTTPFASQEIYSVILDTWVNSAASRLKWTGKKEAALVCCTDITKYKNKV